MTLIEAIDLHLAAAGEIRRPGEAPVWPAGMLFDDGVITVRTDGRRRLVGVLVLNDPATVGVLWGLFCRATGDPRAYFMFCSAIAAWVACARGHEPVESYDSPGEALAEALIALARRRRDGT